MPGSNHQVVKKIVESATRDFGDLIAACEDDAVDVEDELHAEAEAEAAEAAVTS